MTQTIKQHLAVIREALAFYATDEQPEGWHAIDALQHLAASEAKLDAPMRSVDSWAEPWEQISTDRPEMLGENLRGFISAIQADAIASKLPEVDIGKVSCDVMKMLNSTTALRHMSADKYNEIRPIIHKALLKARGGV